MPVKKLFDVGQRGVIFFIYASWIYLLNTLHFIMKYI
jgi:hypothetical protein